MTLAEVAALRRLGWDTVRQIVKSDLGRRHRRIPLKGVRGLAVEVFHLGRKGKFLTVAIGLESGRILWVAKGRREAALARFFRRLRRSRARIEAVACDMAAACWGALVRHLPGADVVFDHFHVIKLASEKLDDLRRGLQPEAGILGRKYLKGSRCLLLTGSENVSEDRKEAPQEALPLNEPLSTACCLKEKLRAFWSLPTLALVRQHLHSWCKRAIQSGIAQLVSLAKTLTPHATGSLDSFNHKISTGRLEGINNKIRALKRKAYGYRDREFLILKLFSLHESKTILTGI